jgi:hypothetical protein
MARKHPFPPEPDTKPEVPKAGAAVRASGPALKSDRERSEAPTLPPPRAEHSGAAARRIPSASRRPAVRAPATPPPIGERRTPTRRDDGSVGSDPARAGRHAEEPARASGVRARRSTRSSTPAATVDEVVADLSKDPRRDRDDD